MAADILSRPASNRGSFRDPADVFRRASADRREEDDEDLKWAAIEKLPTMERMGRALVHRDNDGGDGKAVVEEIDIRNLGVAERKLLVEQILRVVEEDNERFLSCIKARIDRLSKSKEFTTDLVESMSSNVQFCLRLPFC